MCVCAPVDAVFASTQIHYYCRWNNTECRCCEVHKVYIELSKWNANTKRFAKITNMEKATAAPMHDKIYDYFSCISGNVRNEHLIYLIQTLTTICAPPFVRQSTFHIISLLFFLCANFFLISLFFILPRRNPFYVRSFSSSMSNICTRSVFFTLWWSCCRAFGVHMYLLSVSICLVYEPVRQTIVTL